MADYQIQPVRFGLGGLDLRRAPDLVKPEDALRLTNVIHTPDGAWQARPGMTSYATTGASQDHHSVKRLEDPVGGTITRLWGAGTNLYRGTSGALGAAIDTGYSGNPLSMVPWHPPQSGESWMVVGDSLKMRKVRASDGLVLPVGLPAPSTPVVATVAEETLNICEFESGFVPRAGTGGMPVLSYPAGLSTLCLQYVVTPPAGFVDYYNYAIQDFGGVTDFSHFGGGDAITADDYIHLWLKIQHARVIGGNPATGDLLQVSIYLINNFGFGDTYLPGTNDAQNTQYYKATISIPAVTQLTDGNWAEFGAPTSTAVVQLRRSDFSLFGPLTEDDPNAGWEHLRGICVQVVANSSEFSGGVLSYPLVTLDNMFFRGGVGLDTGETEADPYTYKITNFDSRTGAESNGSNVSAEVSPLRQSVTVDPAAFGDASVRQRVYRKGGTITDDWHFVGVNSTDGGVFTDTISDATAEAGDDVPTDHFQPVPTVDSTGTSVLGNPVPYLWGPVDGLIYAAGDKYRPGAVYFCKPGEVDHWGASDFCDVCGPTERVINGFILGNQTFAWSTQKLYLLNTLNTGTAITVSSSATGCTRAPAGPWAFAVGATFCVFCAADGIWITDGGSEKPLSEDWIRPLFRGETSNGYAPVDFSVPNALRLEIHQNEVWFFYADTAAQRRVLIYNLNDEKWRMYQFGKATEMGYSENAPGTTQLILGGHGLGTSYLHAGIGDAGTAVSCNIRTGTLNQDNPRSDKLYGDILLDLDRQNVNIQVVPYINHQVTALRTLNIRTGSGRSLYRYNFDIPPVRALNTAIDISWASSLARPSVYLAYLSFLQTPEQVQSRPLDWELGGNLSTKIVKGIILEVDTLGVHKLLNIELDGVVVEQIDIVADGRRVIERSWDPAEGHELRLIPADEVGYELYSYQWLFDLEPYTLDRWETELINHGFPGWQMPTGGFITVKSTAAITLQVTGYNQTGVSIVKTYTIPSTGGIKTNCFVPFEATKGVLYKYLLTSSVAFRLYREESHVLVQPWAGGEAQPIHVFGNDDLDPTRGMGIASLAASTPGGEAP